MDSARTLYTVEDIEALPEDRRVELIDGVMYDMAAPSTTHQRIISQLVWWLQDIVKRNKGKCQVFPAPFAVYLSANNRSYLEPDVVVVCDPDRIDEKGCHGAPDFVAEVVSESSERRDYAIKLFKYRTEGVKEYWIIDPRTRYITVYKFDRLEEEAAIYSIEEDIPVGVLGEEIINLGL